MGGEREWGVGVAFVIKLSTISRTPDDHSRQPIVLSPTCFQKPHSDTPWFAYNTVSFDVVMSRAEMNRSVIGWLMDNRP